MDAIAVELPGAHVGQVAVPHLIGALAQHDLVRLDRVVFAVEQAQLDAGRVLGEDREVDALAVPSCAEWIGLAWPDTHIVWSVLKIVPVE